jgi:ribosomal protein L40E
MTVESNICTRCARSLKQASASKKVSNTPLRLKRQELFVQSLDRIHYVFGSNV